MSRVGESYKRASLDQEFDAIVIGSGIGGLTVAALLATRAGKRVAVLERHYVAGGYTHAFQRPGYEWDVGLHYVGGQVGEPGSEVRRMFDEITDGRLEWAPMPDTFDRIVIGDRTYEIVSGRERMRERLKTWFPAETRAIDSYFAAVEDVVRDMRFYFLDKALPWTLSTLVGYALRSRFLKYSDRTTKQVLEAMTSNRELIALLTAQYLTYGLPPGQSSFAMHAIIADHYFEGAWYPVGGASRIAAAVAPVISRAGGQIFVGAEVDQILVDRGHAVGVRMADGREIRAGLVVSDAGAVNTFGRLLPRDVAERHGLGSKLAAVEPSPSFVALYLGLDRGDRELGLDGSNLWIHAGSDYDGDIERARHAPESEPPVVYVSFPSAKDPAFASRYPGKSTIDVLAFAPYEWFRRWQDTSWKRRGEDYDAFKNRLADRMLDKVFEYMPHLRGHIAYREVSTPLTSRHFANYAAGEPYGLNHTPERFRQRWLRPASPVRGLFLTGQDPFVEGVTGGLYSGYFSAMAILRRPLLPLRRPKRRSVARPLSSPHIDAVALAPKVAQVPSPEIDTRASASA
jgi:all-trans-retinol 13,14-reductase